MRYPSKAWYGPTRACCFFATARLSISGITVRCLISIRWTTCISKKPIKMNNKKPIFLIGFMGSGKTTWGRKLALKTDRTFIDLDDEIANETRMPIPEYFAQEGEDAFRALESRV